MILPFWSEGLLDCPVEPPLGKERPQAGAKVQVWRHFLHSPT